MEKIKTTEFHPANGFIIKPNPLYRDQNCLIKKSVSDDEARIRVSRYSGKRRHSDVYIQDKRRKSHSSSSEEPSKFRKIKMSKHQRSRIVPELVGNEETIYMNDPEYVLMRRTHVSPRVYGDPCIRHQDGTYIIDELGHNYYVIPRAEEGHGKARFASDRPSIRRASSLRETRSKQEQDKFRSASEAAVRGREYLQFPKSKGHLSDQDRPRGQNSKLAQKKRLRKAEEDEEMKRANEMSGSLPGSVESDDAGSPTRHSSDTSDVDMGLIDGVVFGVKQAKSVGPDKNSETAVKTVEHSEASDSDSGIGKSRMERQLNLKNSELMTKKSIFTIAFDDVKTDPIKSAESVPSTPPQI